MAPTGTPSNVIVGFADLYIAPANTASPIPAVTVGSATFQPISTPWEYSGFTETGVILNVDRKTQNIMVEEQSTPVAVVDDTTDVTIDVTFAEDTIENMLNAYGGGVITTTAATANSPGQTQLVLADGLEQLAVCFTATNAFGFERLVYIPQMVSAGKVKTQYMRNKSPRLYPATFTAVCALSQIAITDLTAVVS